MKTKVTEDSTSVPLESGKSVTIEPGYPWPSAYRGSRYSLVSESYHDSALVKWEHRDLSITTEPPDSLHPKLVMHGKGYGSFRVTANGEILTKVPADEYKHVDKAPIDSGWIPVYVGKLQGSIDFGEVDLDPRLPMKENIGVWPGFPFSHGERWTVSHDGKLIWKWRDYRFGSAFSHPELVAAYQQYRGTAGRLYITENGHIWINVPNDDIAPAKETEVKRAIQRWKQSAEENGDTAALKLVNRRLVATSREDDPSTGHFPLHLGRLKDFDDGKIPTAIVDKPSYFQAVCEYEQVWE